MNQRILLAFLLLALVIPIGFCEDQYSSAHTKIIGIRELGDNQYSGVIADLTVEVRPGEGHVFMDTIPLTKIDTQASARLAREVACQTLSIDCSNLDFFYIIRSSYVMIGGPSAGAALTVATMAALQNVELNEDVVDNIYLKTGPLCNDSDKIIIDALLKKYTNAGRFELSSLDGTIRK